MSLFGKKQVFFSVLLLLLAIPFTVFLSQQVQNLRQRAAVSDNPFALFAAELTTIPTFNSISIELPFVGDMNKNSEAKLEFKKSSESIWREGLPLWAIYHDVKIQREVEGTVGTWLPRDANNVHSALQNSDDRRAAYSTTEGSTHTFELSREISEFVQNDRATIVVIGNTVGDDDVTVELLLDGAVIHAADHDLSQSESITTSSFHRVWANRDEIEKLQLRIKHKQVGTSAEEVILQGIRVVFDTYTKRAFYGSALLLEPGTPYDFRVTISDPDGGNTVLTDSETTRAENIPHASTLTPTHFVRITGDDTKAGTTDQFAWRTLEKALQDAPSGAVVEVGPGVYPPPKTNRTNPITLYAQFPSVDNNQNIINPTQHTIIEPKFMTSPNTNLWKEVTLTGPATNQQFKVWKWANVPTPKAQYMMIAKTRSATEVPERIGFWKDEGSETDLLTNQTYVSTTPEGWAEIMHLTETYNYGMKFFPIITDPNKPATSSDIYVRLPGDRNPNDYFVWVNNIDTTENMRLDGPNIRYSGFQIRLSDFYITPKAENGVFDHMLIYNGKIRSEGDKKVLPPKYAKSLVIEHNRMVSTGYWSENPNAGYMPWLFMKGGTKIPGTNTKPPGETPEEVKFSGAGKANEEYGSAINSVGTPQGMIIRHNVIDGYFNGINGYNSDFDRYSWYGTDIHDNLFRNIADDALEPEGQAINLRIWNNKIEDSMVALSTGPVRFGPVYFFKNQAWRIGLHGAPLTRLGIKGSSGGTAAYFFKFSGGSDPTARVYVINNTFWTEYPDMNGGAAAAGGSSHNESFYMRNNILNASRYILDSLRMEDERIWDEDYNHFETTDPKRGMKSMMTLAEYRATTGEGAHTNIAGDFHDQVIKEQYDAIASGSMALKPESIFIDKGIPVPNIMDNYDDASSYTGAAPDLGAIESGGTGQPQPTSTPTPTGSILLSVTPTYSPTPTRSQVTNTPAPLSPTNTPLPGTTTLFLTVKIHGIGTGGDTVNPTSIGNMNPVRTQRPVTVDFYTAINNSKVGSTTGSVSFDSGKGVFIGSVTVPAGLTTTGYNIVVSSGGYLPTTQLGFLMTENQINTLPTVSLVTGDIKRDNVLDILDYNILVTCYGAQKDVLPSGCTDMIRPDLFDDGNVNFIDLNLWLREFSKKN